eukprot:scaffold5816_cov267-Pinguiococcus_pyrenoidosus.AAC.15
MSLIEAEVDPKTEVHVEAVEVPGVRPRLLDYPSEYLHERYVRSKVSRGGKPVLRVLLHLGVLRCTAGVHRGRYLYQRQPAVLLLPVPRCRLRVPAWSSGRRVPTASELHADSVPSESHAVPGRRVLSDGGRSGAGSVPGRPGAAAPRSGQEGQQDPVQHVHPLCVRQQHVSGGTDRVALGPRD